MFKPVCEKPLLLINKYALTLLQSGCELVLGGSRVAGCYCPSPITLHSWLEVARKSNDDYIANSYVYDGVYKEYLFMYVPCNTCVLCRHSKQIDLINRCTLESLSWDTPPLFFTLTYNEGSLPHLKYKKYDYPELCRGNLCYRDVQLFWKRLRTNLDRQGIPHDMRYLVSGEYGHRFHRPHYHVILFNNPYQADELHPYLMDMMCDEIFRAWQKCDYHVLHDPNNFGQCRGGAAGYATKYVTKPFFMPKGCTVKPFIRCSSGFRGGLGSIFFKDFIDNLRDNPQQNFFEYTDSKGNYKYMYLSKTFSHMVWKSPSALVPVRYRNLFNQLTKLLQSCVDRGVYDYESSFNLIELLRIKYVANNLKVNKVQKCCPTFSQLVKKKIDRLISSLVDDLSEVIDFDDEYIDSYYRHKQTVFDNLKDFAVYAMSIKQKIALLLDKTKF